MNILIPHNWLLEHLETDASPNDIQRELSLAGPSVERIIEDGDQAIYDIEITTNRVDSMSVRGVAREAAVILNQAGIKAKLKPLSIPNPQETNQLPLPKIFNQPELSGRVICVVLSHVQRTATPSWMTKRLQQVGMNVHDSTIDITNYVTHELGHPCHAFDYDKLMATGGEIRVEEAKKGETFTTLDGESYATVGGEVVFKNSQGIIIDLPSIKGTQNTSIDDQTQNILLLMESIKADRVRFASMTHTIRTIAAQLMEKNVDPHLAGPVLKRGIQLYQELCLAEVASPIFDEFYQTKPPRPVITPLAIFDKYLGIQLSPTVISTILKDLGCLIELDETKTNLVVQPPTFRPDLTIPADIVEEVARIYGYHNLPSRLMPTAIPTIYPSQTNFDWEEKAKTFLSLVGWQEVYTYSLVSQDLAKTDGLTAGRHLKLQNPLTEDRVYLRRNLWPSLMEVLDQNPLETKYAVFELANTYIPQTDDLPKEELILGLASHQTTRQVRGVVEALLDYLFVDKYEFIPDQKQLVTTIYATARNSQSQYKLGTLAIKSGKCLVELEWKKILAVANTHPQYQAPSSLPTIIEDLTFVLQPQQAVGPIMQTMQKISPLIINVTFVDQYHQNTTFRLTYHDPQHSLNSNQLKPIRQKLVGKVERAYGARLVGKV
ncbi:phenylalanine--tRNA ligase subunit beta [Patescibacteria group bacterium]|nr:phenylalanine--tRNA ligase subunit beta [Patescibacteria group bacterium]